MIFPAVLFGSSLSPTDSSTVMRLHEKLVGACAGHLVHVVRQNLYGVDLDSELLGEQCGDVPIDIPDDSFPVWVEQEESPRRATGDELRGARHDAARGRARARISLSRIQGNN